MRRISYSLIVALTLALGLSACGGPPTLDHGRVIGKQYEPAQTRTIFIPIQTGQVCSGNICTPIMTPIPFTEYDGEDWYLVLQDGKKVGRAYVTEGIYGDYDKGDWFGPKSKAGVASKDTNNRKERKG